MTQGLKTLAAPRYKSNSLCLIPGTHLKVDGEKRVTKSVSEPHICTMHLDTTHTEYTHTLMNRFVTF